MSWLVTVCIVLSVFAVVSVAHLYLLNKSQKNQTAQIRDLSSRISEVSAENLVHCETVSRLRSRLLRFEAERARLQDISQNTDWAAIQDAVREYMSKKKSERKEVDIQTLNRFQELLDE